MQQSTVWKKGNPKPNKVKQNKELGEKMHSLKCFQTFCLNCGNLLPRIGMCRGECCILYVTFVNFEKIKQCMLKSNSTYLKQLYPKLAGGSFPEKACTV